MLQSIVMDRIFEIFKDVGNEIIEALRDSRNKKGALGITGMGADGTLTHFMDKISEDILIKQVNQNDLPYNIVSEEAGFIDRKYESNIIVDPLDGTFNAEQDIPFYSISIATMGRSFDTLDKGFVMNLSNGDVFTAESGKGSFKNNKRISASGKRNNAFILNMSGILDDMTVALLKKAGRVRAIGCASLEMCLVASGSVDLMAYLGRSSYIRNIDVAAGVLIVREAGGFVIDPEGATFNMGLDVSERKNIIAGRSRNILEGVI